MVVVSKDKTIFEKFQPQLLIFKQVDRCGLAFSRLQGTMETHNNGIATSMARVNLEDMITSFNCSVVILEQLLKPFWDTDFVNEIKPLKDSYEKIDKTTYESFAFCVERLGCCMCLCQRRNMFFTLEYEATS